MSKVEIRHGTPNAPAKLRAGEDDMTLGGRIKMQMAIHGILTKADLARRIKVHRQTVTKWLNNEVQNLEPEYLFKLADVLECNPRWLALREGMPQAPRELKFNESKVLELYQRLPKGVRDTWIQSAESMLKELADPSVAQPFKYSHANVSDLQHSRKNAPNK